MTKSKQRPKIGKDTLNLIIAGCAVLISAASFYATYLQAQSEEKQVKAATWPYLQISSGNYDAENDEHKISVTIENVGVGPAIIKSFKTSYDGVEINDIYDIFTKCCAPEGKDKSWLINPENRAEIGFIVTDTVENKILPNGNAIEIFQLKKTDTNQQFWDAVNNSRWKMSGDACYCSLLENCYQTDFENEPVPVKLCKDVSMK
jgi:hypothetical protein